MSMKIKRLIIGGISLSNLNCRHDQILGTSSNYHKSLYTLIERCFLEEFLGEI
jgi:hypothetical protein